MGWEGWFTLGVIVFSFSVMVRGLAPPDMVLWGAAVLVTVVGVVTPDEMISGLAEPAVATIGALFVISAAMRETGALDLIGKRVLGRARTERGALLRLIPQVTALSAFLNNTAVVAMFMSVVSDWCRRHRISPSRLLLPLSYLSILGGMCTLIGTSINLIVSAQMEKFGLDALGMFELSWIGVPCALLGAIYLLVVGRRLLPDRKDLLEQFGESSREYMIEMRIQPNCTLVGQSIREAGLRRLPGLFLIEIVRDGHIIAPVEPDEILRAEDQLTFTGVVSTIVDLERIPGFVPVADDQQQLTPSERRSRRYGEAVISHTSPLIGKNIREANFRALYNAAVVAVHRGGERLKGRIGDIVLRAGDTLLLQTGQHFAAANRNNPDFFLVSSVEEARPVRHERAYLSLGLLGLLIVLLVWGSRFGMPMAVSALFVAGLLIMTRCIAVGDARRSLNLDVLFTIAAAFALGAALSQSGAAEFIAGGIVSATAYGGMLAALALIYGVTIAFNTLITSNATAVLVFPIAMAVADRMDADPRTFAIMVASAAAASFATPIAYQTNVLVYGPGGYRFADFLRVGLPLHALLWVLAVVLIPIVWG